MLLAAGGMLQSRNLEHSVFFRRPEVIAYKHGDYDLVVVSGLPLDNRPGAPLLPVKYVHLLLPPGIRATALDVVYSDEKIIEGRYLPAPGMKELPLSERPGGVGPKPDDAIYGSTDIYPPLQAELAHQGSMGGMGVATIKVYPVRYRGAERQLLHSTQITISLRWDGEKNTNSITQSAAMRELAARLVDNRPAMEAWYPKDRLGKGRDSAADLLIITAAPFDTVLGRLAEWKASRGLVTVVAATESIYAGTSGSDRQEKIRNFIREKLQTLGISYVMLGGDTAVVPARVAFAMASGYDSLAPGRDSLRADLYYSDLDGTWDENGNWLYGELADSVDLYPDVIVGRAPINILSDAQTLVRKVMEYEQGTVWDHLDKASLWAEMLDNVTDGAAGAEIINRDQLTPFFKPAEKLYETSGNQTRASTIEAYRQGRHLINHIGHAWYTSMNVGPGFSSLHEIRAGDFDTIPTNGRWGIIYSIGCMPAAIERNCIAERFVNSSTGGGVAFIGNCSYGWYLPYFAGYGSSDRYNQQFFLKLLAEEAPALGTAHAAAKAHFIGAAQGENEYRWIMYGLNLIGDPTLAVWTDSPESLTAACPDSLAGGENMMAVAVLKNGMTQAEAMVTIIGDSVFGRAMTDGAGQAFITVLSSPGDTLRLTATARNAFPLVKSIPVVDSGPQVSLLGWQAAEAAGNGDGLAGPGEEISLWLRLMNTGNQSLGDSLQLVLSRLDANSRLLDSTFSVAAPAPGESLGTGPGFLFMADSGLDDGEMALFNLSIYDSWGRCWSRPLGVRLAAPAPSYAGYRIDDRSGNGNGIPEPGETFKLYVNIINKGRATLEGSSVYLTTNDPYLTMADSALFPPTLWPDSIGSYAFQVYIDPAMPGPWRVPMFFLQCRQGWMEWRDSLAVPLGQVGLADDMETGVPGWQAGGGWHLSQIRSQSPSHSWYFGSESDTLTPQYSIDTLVTPLFAVGPQCSLAYWQRYEFIPGWSWGVVEICGDFGARLLEVVEGSSNQWRLSCHDLSAYPPGAALFLRFIAVCDSFRSEGWYLDDVNVFGPPTGASGIPTYTGQQRFILHQARPNPAQNHAAIGFNLPQAGKASLGIYNIQGQLVRSLASGEMKAGWHNVVWDGQDDRGRAVAGGVYLCRLRAGWATATSKIVIVR